MWHTVAAAESRVLCALLRALQKQHLLALLMPMLASAYGTDSILASRAALTNSLCTPAVTGRGGLQHLAEGLVVYVCIMYMHLQMIASAASSHRESFAPLQ